MRRTTVFQLGTVAALFILAAFLIACESSDPTAVEGSVIILTLTPNPVDLTNDPTGTSQVAARLETATGVPQTGTLILFTVTNGLGSILPAAENTDDNGVARATYTSTAITSATIEARSASIIATKTLSVVGATPAVHTLNSSDADLTVCIQNVPLSGELRASNGDPIAGIQVRLELNPDLTDSEVAGNFVPQSVVSDASGNYTSTFTLTNASCAPCSTKACNIVLIARAPGRDANNLTVTDSFN